MLPPSRLEVGMLKCQLSLNDGILNSSRGQGWVGRGRQEVRSKAFLLGWPPALHTLPSPVHQASPHVHLPKGGRLHVTPCSETFHELLLSKSPPLALGCASHFPAQHSVQGSASCWVISFIPQPRIEGKDVPCILLGFEVTDRLHSYPLESTI